MYRQRAELAHSIAWAGVQVEALLCKFVATCSWLRAALPAAHRNVVELLM